MAKIIDWTAEQRASWKMWVASRPPEVAAMCRRFPPDRLYRMRDTNQRVTLVSYAEDGTVRVAVSGQFNLIATIERTVFGVDPNNLEECDLPGPDEPVGCLFDETTGMAIARAFYDAASATEGRQPELRAINSQPPLTTTPPLQEEAQWLPPSLSPARSESTRLTRVNGNAAASRIHGRSVAASQRWRAMVAL